MGKTRTAHRWSAQHAASVWDEAAVVFCDLRATDTEHGLVTALGQRLDVRVAGDTGREVRALGAALASRGRCLVVLDNFEALVESSASVVGDWLDVARDASFLVTSRQLLRLRGEQVFELPPLSLSDETAEPRASDAPSIVEVMKYDERVRRVAASLNRRRNAIRASPG